MSNETRIIGENEARELGASLLSEGRSVRFKLGGNSMFPFLRQGDVATIKPVPIAGLKLGQVIVFEHNGRWIAHRLVAIKKEGNAIELFAHGDSSKNSDLPISEERYFGLISEFSRNGKHFDLDGFFNDLYAKLMLVLRPLPQRFIHLFLRVRNRLTKL